MALNPTTGTPVEGQLATSYTNLHTAVAANKSWVGIVVKYTNTSTTLTEDVYLKISGGNDIIAGIPLAPGESLIYQMRTLTTTQVLQGKTDTASTVNFIITYAIEDTT